MEESLTSSESLSPQPKQQKHFVSTRRLFRVLPYPPPRPSDCKCLPEMDTDFSNVQAPPSTFLFA